MNITAGVPMYYESDESYNKSETKKMSAADKKAYGDYNGKMRAEHDAGVLLEAEEIRMDTKRHRKAVLCLKDKKKKIEQATDH